MMLSLFPALVIGLVIWAGLVGDASPWTIGIGVLVVLSGWGIAMRVTGTTTTVSLRRLPKALFYFCRYFLIHVIPSALLSCVMVIGKVFKPSDACRPAIVAVDLGRISPEAAFLLSFALTLSPGDQVVDVDTHSGKIFIHTMEVPDPDAFRAKVQNQYERHVKEILR